MSWEPVQMEEEVGMSGCENHAEPPKHSQGHQRQEDQLCVCVCVCLVCVHLFVCVYGLTAGRKCWSERMTDRPLPV